MKKELFKLLVAEFEKLGINPTKWLGTRTNVKRINKKNMADTAINEFAIQREFDDKGVTRILKLFDEEARYLAQLNDVQGNQLLNNLKTVNKIVKPPPKPEAGIYSLKEGKKFTADEFAEKKAADRQKLDSAILKASMDVSKVDTKLAERLNLDMSKVSDWEKLQAWKDKHGVPDWAKESHEGIGSLFKVVDDNPLADLGSQLDNIEKEGKSLLEEAQKLTDLAWKMSPEGQAAEKAIRNDILKRSYEGKGFAGGIFGDRSDGFFRAVVRPFLLAQHDKGKIKLADNTYKSLKNMDDLKGGGDFMDADPVRVFRLHYGDNAFDLIPKQEAFGMGPSGYGPTSETRNAILEGLVGKPIVKVGPDNPGGYLTKGEYKAKLDHEDDVLRSINEGEGRFGDMSQEEVIAEIADVKTRKDTIKMAMDQDYPGYEVISGESKKGKEIAEKLGITAKPGFPVTEAGKADLKVVKPKKKIDRPSIRLIKNFDQELDDIGLAKEGYNLQEIGILKRARDVMKKEGQNPDDALTWVRGEMADEAGVDIEEFMPDFDWGDFPGKDSFAQGGGVGSMFRRV